MPAINVARTDTFEQQRIKINQIGDQIFNVTAGGSDLSTGNLKLGDGTLSNPSLGFVNDNSLGLYRPETGVIGYVYSNKLIYTLSQQGFLSYRDFTVRQNKLEDIGLTIIDGGQNYDPGSYNSIPLTGGTGESATANIVVAPFFGTENQGSNYSAGSFSNIPLVGGSTATRSFVSFNVDAITLDITDAGSGYTDGFYQNVPLVSVTGSGSGAEAEVSISGGFTYNGTITGGSGYSDGNTFSVPLYNQPTQTFVVTVIGDGVGTPFQYVLNGSTEPTLNFVPGNTYRFDVSDSTNSNHSLYLRQVGGAGAPSEIRVTTVGTSGTTGAFVEVIVDPTYNLTTLEYSCIFHQTMGGTINFAAGAVGVYGYGATADFTISSGSVTSIAFDLTGTDYKATDVLVVSQLDIGPGTGFEFLINSIDNNGVIAGIVVTDSGINYQQGDILTINAADVGGTGQDAEFSINSNPGTISSFSFDSQATDYQQGDILSIPGPVSGVSVTLVGSDGGATTPETTFTVPDVSNIVPGSVVTQTGGTGLLNQLQDTLVVAVDYDNNSVSIDVDPDTSGSATLTFTPPYGDATVDFTYTIDSVGPIESLVISNPGVGYFVGDSLSVNSLDLVQPITYFVKSISVQHLEFNASTIPSGTFSVGDFIKLPDGTPTSVSITSSTVVNTGGSPVTYSNVPVATTSGNGTGETFTIERDGAGNVTGAIPDQVGLFYQDGDTVVIRGTDVGGSTPSDDITLTIDSSTVSSSSEIYQVSESGGFTNKLIVSDVGFFDLDSIFIVGNVSTQYTILTASLSGDRIVFSVSLDSGSDDILPDITLLAGNTYNFDTTDSSNSGHNFNLSSYPGGIWGSSLIENISTTVDLDVTSSTVTVADTSGIVAGMSVTLTSGTGAIAADTTVVSVDSGTTLTISSNPTQNGDATLSFAGVAYEDGVSVDAGVVSVKVTSTTSSPLYYYDSNTTTTNNSDAGGLPGNEATITIDLNNPKVFGSGFDLSVISIDSIDAINLDVVTGQVLSTSLNTGSINGSSANLSGQLVSDSVSTNTIATSEITTTNLSVTGASVSFNGPDVSVGGISLQNSTGDISTNGSITTSGDFNSNNRLFIIDQEISSAAGYNIDIAPATNQITKIIGTTALVIPSGNTTDRPSTLAQDGAIRFNTQTNQYEGYSSSSASWSSLGGVRDLDGNTTILAELTVGANDNTLWFINDNVNTIKITPQLMDFVNVKTIGSSKLGLPVFTDWKANTPYLVVGEYLRFGNNIYEIATAGTSGTTGPSHTTGTEANGNQGLTLTWYSSSVSPLSFSSVEEVRIDPNGVSPLVVNGDLAFSTNVISSRISDILIRPNSGKKVVVDAATSFVLPVGSDGDRGSAAQGSVRFNTTSLQYEGYDGNNWGSLGGVKDVNQNTYIIPELSPGSDENILYFFNDNDNTLRLTTTQLEFDTIDTLVSTTSDEFEFTASLITFDNATLSFNNQSLTSTFISTTKQYLDLGLSTGLVTDPVLRLEDNGDIFYNLGFGTGNFNGVKVFDSELKEFELSDYLIKTDSFTLIKGTTNLSSTILYNISTQKGCKVSVVAKNTTTGEKTSIDFNVIDNGSDIFHNEYGTVNTSSDLISASFDFTVNNETRITIALTSNVLDTESVEISVVSHIYK